MQILDNLLGEASSSVLATLKDRFSGITKFEISKESFSEGIASLKDFTGDLSGLVQSLVSKDDDADNAISSLASALGVKTPSSIDDVFAMISEATDASELLEALNG